jgi:hypothetical protein
MCAGRTAFLILLLVLCSSARAQSAIPCDGASDATSAIEAAYLAAATTVNGAKRPLVLPSGRCVITAPLLFPAQPISHGSFTPVSGAGGVTATPGTSITAATPTFPALMFYPPDYVPSLGTIAAAPLVGSTGHSLQFNANRAWQLVMNELQLVNATNPLNRSSPVFSPKALIWQALTLVWAVLCRHVI